MVVLLVVFVAVVVRVCLLSFRFFLLTRAHVNQDSHSPGIIAAAGVAPAPGVEADFWGLWVPFFSLCDVRKNGR